MAANTKTPLHSVVSVICDLVAELTPDDQLRALEGARVSLGLRASRATSDLREPREPAKCEEAERGCIHLHGHIGPHGNWRLLATGWPHSKKVDRCNCIFCDPTALPVW